MLKMMVTVERLEQVSHQELVRAWEEFPMQANSCTSFLRRAACCNNAAT